MNLSNFLQLRGLFRPTRNRFEKCTPTVVISFRYETAVSEREDLERELGNLRTNVDDCTITRVDLERQLVTLREELDFDNLAHAEVTGDNYLTINVRSALVSACKCKIAPKSFFDIHNGATLIWTNLF